MAEEEVSRRGFLGWAAGSIAALGSLFVAIPLVGSIVTNVQAKNAEAFVTVGDVSGLKPDEPQAFPFLDDVRDAFLREQVPRMVWVVKRPNGAVIAYSPVCPHLGCEFFLDPAERRFVCPCHASQWNVDGQVLHGPTPRPMDTLPSKVVDGSLQVRWVQYETGTSAKIPVG